MKIVIVTAEPKANYHFNYFTKEQAKHLVHLVPDLDSIQGNSFVKTVTGLENLEEVNLLVMEGGGISEWTKTVGFYANSKGIPVVLSEMAYNSSEHVDFEIPKLEGISAVSPYGSFNYHGYLDDDMVEITVTGHPMLDSLPKYNPIEGRVLILSSEFKADGGVGLKDAIRSLEESGYRVEVRPHPRENEAFWNGFRLTDEPNLLKDVAKSSVVVGVPGTGFTAAVALGVPTIALEGSTDENTLPEYRYIFKYVKPKNILEATSNIEAVDDKSREFITGPVGGAGERLLKFWESKALTDDEIFLNR